MIEYFYSDIIIDPTNKDVEGLIGKEVYPDYYPMTCLIIAKGSRNGKYRCFLESIELKSVFPFYIRTIEADNPESISYGYFPCIIPKKE